MILKFVHIIIISMIYPQASAQYSSIIARSGCNPTCGNVDIPFPFGMKDPKCYADKWFEIECKNTTQGKKPYLKHINLEVRDIDIYSWVTIMNPIYRRNCKSKDAGSVVDLRGGPFVYSQDANKFLAVGCNKIAFLVSNGSQVSGCVSICDDKEDVDDDMYRLTCNGKYCCETSLPSYLSEYNATIQDLSKDHVSDQCRWALIFQSYSYYQNDDYTSIDLLKDVKHAPAVLEWEIPNNSTLKLPIAEFSYCNATNFTSSLNTNSGSRCSCNDGFYGNPYVTGGCKDSDSNSNSNSNSDSDSDSVPSWVKWAIVGNITLQGQF